MRFDAPIIITNEKYYRHDVSFQSFSYRDKCSCMQKGSSKWKQKVLFSYATPPIRYVTIYTCISQCDSSSSEEGLKTLCEVTVSRF